MRNETATGLATEFPHIPTVALAAGFDQYNALRDVGATHEAALRITRETLTMVYGVSDPNGKVSL